MSVRPAVCTLFSFKASALAHLVNAVKNVLPAYAADFLVICYCWKPYVDYGRDMDNPGPLAPDKLRSGGTAWNRHDIM